MSQGQRKVLAWLPAVIWMGTIFLGSTDVLSNQHTSRFIGPFLHWLYPAISSEAVDRVQFVVRKFGHLTEYAVLAVLLRWALQNARELSFRVWNNRTAWGAWTIASLYAATDEFHQAFVASRYASPWDVLIDSTGAALGLGLCYAWYVLLRAPDRGPAEAATEVRSYPP